MKKILHETGFLFAVVFLVMVLMPLAGQAEEQTGLTVSRAAICNDIVEHEPVDKGTTFTSDVNKLYCFSEIMGAQTNTHITHVWYFMGTERARVELKVNGSKWRTSSSKRIQDFEIGDWEVKILDAEDTVLKVLKFTITAQ